MGTSFARSFVRTPSTGGSNHDSAPQEALGRVMRPIANQIADRLPVRRAIRARISRAVSLLLLVGLVSACGGTGGQDAPQTDPDLRSQRSRESWERELVSVSESMTANPLETYWPYRMAEIEVALDSTVQASASLDRALALDPDHIPALLLLSKLHYENDRYEDAVSLLDAALTRSPQAEDALRMALAINLEAMGEVEAAQRILAECAQDPSGKRGVESFLSLRGDAYLESLEIAEAAVQADPSSASNHNNLGVALLYEGNPEGARASFLRALDLDPVLAGALYNLTIVETYYFYDLEKGRVWFERYARLETEDPDELGAVFGVDLAAQDPRTYSTSTGSSSSEDRRAQ